MMLIILPNEIDGLTNIENNLEKINLNYAEIFSGYYKPEIKVYLPKFKIETTIDLTVVLKQVIY